MGGSSSASGGSGGTTSSANGGSGGSGGSANCPQFSDELDDPSTLSCWSLRHQVEGDPAQYDSLDVGQTVPGHLVIRPTAGGWYNEQEHPLVYKEFGGDFVVETYAMALDETDPNLPTSDDYHSAGLMLRDPASDTGTQNWLMYNTGYQVGETGTEGKTTVDSNSVLTLLPGTFRGRLRICRLGAEYRMFKWLEGETDWTLEHTYTRPDLPGTLQVGMVTNAWPPQGGPDRNIEARFDYIRVGSVASVADCTATIVPL
jgi:hypothetical protein